MAMRIVKDAPETFPKTKAKKAADYLDFIRKLPCCVTGKHGVEAAHLSFANPRFCHYGRGKGTKASDSWALPLCPEEHRRQHSMAEDAYWYNCTLVHPHLLAVTLWGLWSELGDAAEPFAIARIYDGISLLEAGDRR